MPLLEQKVSSFMLADPFSEDNQPEERFADIGDQRPNCS